MSQPIILDETSGATSPEHTIEVRGIPEALLERLDERARALGGDRSQIIQTILAKELGIGETDLTTSNLDTVLDPIRQGFAESGLSEDEATALLEDGLRAVRREKQLGNLERFQQAVS